jgi:hypothetical protein
MDNNLKISKQLRRKGLGGGGFQISKIRRPFKRVPSWFSSNEKMQEILLTSFPLMKTNKKQRKSAGRWARILYFYYRKQYSRGQIAEELNLTYKQVDNALSGISRVAKGLRYDGRGKRSRGRPNL